MQIYKPAANRVENNSSRPTREVAQDNERKRCYTFSKAVVKHEDKSSARKSVATGNQYNRFLACSHRLGGTRCTATIKFAGKFRANEDSRFAAALLRAWNDARCVARAGDSQFLGRVQGFSSENGTVIPGTNWIDGFLT